MLAFDIETTGLDAYRNHVTVAAVYDPSAGIKHVYNFARVRHDKQEHQRVVDEFLAVLDDAEVLCAFNGVIFDIPFIQISFRVDAARVGRWVLKTVDLFYRWKMLQNRTFSLDRLLIENGKSVKTSKGCFAVDMAREGRWEELEDYCMNDAILTHVITAEETIKIPEHVPYRR